MSGDFRVDCDSHVIEPFDLWLNYMEPELREWCVQFREPLATGRLWEMYPHPEAPTTVLDDLGRLAAGIPDDARRARFLGGAAAQLFTIPTGESLVRAGTTVT